jgi:hypothetical protein
MKAKLTNRADITRRDALKRGAEAATLAKLGAGAAFPVAATATALATTDTVNARQPASATPQVTQPATGILMTPGYAKTIAQTAYVWGWPIVNMLNRNARSRRPRTQVCSVAFCLPRHAARSECSTTIFCRLRLS